MIFIATDKPEKYYDNNGDILGWVIPAAELQNAGFLNDDLEFQTSLSAGWLMYNGQYRRTTIICKTYATAHTRAKKYYDKHGQDYPWERHTDVFGEFWTKPKSRTKPPSTTIQSEEMKF